jgi:CBS domain-containing protein
VIDHEKRVVGVISSADISPEGKRRESTLSALARKLGMAGPSKAGEGRVGDVMSAPPITTSPDADIKEVAAVLDMRRIKRLPVVDDQGKLAGIISRGDIIRAMAKK